MYVLKVWMDGLCIGRTQVSIDSVSEFCSTIQASTGNAVRRRSSCARKVIIIVIPVYSSEFSRPMLAGLASPRFVSLFLAGSFCSSKPSPRIVSSMLCILC